MRLAAETPEPAIGRAVRTAGDAVAVAVVGIRKRENLGVGNGIEQSEAKEIGRRAVAGVGRGRGDRLRRQVRVLTVGGCELFLNDLATDGGEVVTLRGFGPGVERRRMDFDVFAAFVCITPTTAHHGLLMAGPAADGVEERAEARFRCELGLENDSANLELPALRRTEPWQRPAERWRNDQDLCGRRGSLRVGRCSRRRTTLAGTKPDDECAQQGGAGRIKHAALQDRIEGRAATCEPPTKQRGSYGLYSGGDSLM